MIIPVLFCIDGNFWQHLGVSIASLLRSNPLHTFRVFVVSASEMNQQEVEKIRSVVEMSHGTLETIVYSQAEQYKHLPTHSHLTFAMYLRLFMTEYLDPELDKILYLDSDIIVCSDIKELWSIPLGDFYLGAAPEPYDERQRSALGFFFSDLYVNSGVMLVNLAKWRNDHVLDKFLAFAESKKHLLIYSPDQDIVNCVLRGGILNIGYKWNWQALFARFAPSELGMTRTEFDKLRRSPKLVHFTSPYKPWYYVWQPHYKNLYYKTLAQTPWSSYKQPDDSWSNVPHHTVKWLQQKLEWHAPAVAKALRDKKYASTRPAQDGGIQAN